MNVTGMNNGARIGIQRHWRYQRLLPRLAIGNVDPWTGYQGCTAESVRKGSAKISLIVLLKIVNYYAEEF